MRRSRAVFAAGWVLLVGTGPAIAEDVGAAVRPAAQRSFAEPPMEPGAIVRLKAPELGDGRARGHLVRFDEERLVVRVRGRVVEVPWSSVRDADIFVGQRRQTGGGVRSGAILGAILGTVVGGIGDNFAGGSSSATFSDYAGGALTGALILGVVGAVLGTAVETEHWTPLARPQRVAIHLEPLRDGVGGVVSLRF